MNVKSQFQKCYNINKMNVKNVKNDENKFGTK